MLILRGGREVILSPTLLTALQLAVRASLAAALGVAIAHLLRLQYPLYALVGAVIVTDISPVQTRELAWRRLAGTVVGAVAGAVFTQFLPAGPIAIGASILVAMFISGLLRLQPAAKIAGYVCGIVVLEHGDQPWVYALFRFAETVLGIGMAVLVSFVPKLIKIEPPKSVDS
ncbi:FUSC family protein [Ramlibacter tataouinensis]|uniref:Uncharacterized protein n=1 Tax=Ramlibacter tataouinensis TaxID=94132 RepID=A0A127JRN1_9BURK|nr:aromatic acid exporter family protein [Ramlibacter tataouinensis]AMO22630.1 hypothetical protein UC35_06705 [Ramlibacter tataouinensis]